MSRPLEFVAALFALWVAAVLDQGLAPRLALLGGSPQFLMLAACLVAMFAEPRAAILFAFGAGVVRGAIAGANLPHYVIAIEAATISMLFLRLVVSQEGLPARSGTVGLSLLAGNIALLLVAPPLAMLPSAGATIGSALYGCVFALPFYALLRRFAGSKAI